MFERVKGKEKMLDEILIVVYFVLVGALLGAVIKDVSLNKIRDENLVLKEANYKLKERVKELDYKQAELTKNIAEMNGIGGEKMLKKIWDNIEIILITLSMLLAMFTVGLILGVYVSSNTIEELSNDNIVKERTIQQQKERIRELQLLKQYKEIYG